MAAVRSEPNPYAAVTVHTFRAYASWQNLPGNAGKSEKDFVMYMGTYSSQHAFHKEIFDPIYLTSSAFFKPEWNNEITMEIWRSKSYQNGIMKITIIPPELSETGRNQLMQDMQNSNMRKNPVINAHVKWQKAGHEGQSIALFLQHLDNCFFKKRISIQFHEQVKDILKGLVRLDGHDQPFEVWRRVSSDGSTFSLYIPPKEGQYEEGWMKVPPTNNTSISS